MEATTTYYPTLPSSTRPTLPGRRFSIKTTGRRSLGRVKKVVSARRSESNDHRDYKGKLVDENMIVLRIRIRDMKMLETNHEPPLNWMEWEKQYYFGHYNEDVCEALGLLQNYLMNTRPCLALGMVALLALSVLISASLLIFNAVEVAKGLLSAFHLS